MKKIFFVCLILALCVIPGISFAQSATSQNSIQSTIGVGVSPSMTYNQSSVDAGQGRWFLPPVQPYNAPIVPYLGPWNSGPNIIEDLRVFPDVITRAQALKMYKGGVTARVHKMADYSYQFETCKIRTTLPTTQLLNKNGEVVMGVSPALDANGKVIVGPDGKSLLQERPVMVLDESKFKRVAIIELAGDADASTTDVIAKAVIEATEDNMGATGIVLVKKVTTNGTRSTGWGIGFGGVAGQLGGAGLTNSQAVSAGTGFNRATAYPIYREGMVVLAIQE